jgi:uncharacterized membrane protein YbhN (UPF0104 family)
VYAVTEAVRTGAPADAAGQSRIIVHKVFGTVPRSAVRRRPSELGRIAGATVLTLLCAVLASRVSTIQAVLYDLVSAVPGDLRDLAQGVYLAATIGVVAVLLTVGLVIRRWRIVGALVLAGLLATLVVAWLREAVDSEDVRRAAGMTEVGVPVFPTYLVAMAWAAVAAVQAEFTRPTRRLVQVILAGAFAASFVAAAAAVTDIVGALGIGAGVAAIARFAFGTPEGTPSAADVVAALDALGVAARDPRHTEAQAWGEVQIDVTGARGETLRVVVIGRDASDARFFAKLWRFLWYKDSGLRLSVNRLAQLEHRAYLLLLAEQAGVKTSRVVATGVAGSKSDALLVIEDPDGVPLDELAPEQLTDEVLHQAWQAAQRLHARRIAHGSLNTHHVLLLADGSVALTELRLASAAAPPALTLADCAELLTTSAVLVGNERALAAAESVLGRAGLAAVLPLLEPTALSADGRRRVAGEKKLMKDLRVAGAALAGVDEPELTSLRRIKASSVVMAVATMLGVYLLFGQLASVDFEAVVTDAEWAWIAVAVLLCQTPQPAMAVAMLGSVATPLPLGVTTVVQFANNFTGLVAGTAGNATLVIRYFQRQGKAMAVAVSSGVLNSAAGFITQLVLVGICLVITASSYSTSDTGEGSNAGVVLLIVLAVAVVLVVTVSIPKLRDFVWSRIRPQLDAAWENLRTIAARPLNLVQLFGGNAAAQILFATTLGACLHAYGGSLSLVQLVLINSFASFVGGAVPVPGGMGVVEAGLIAGLTAAGVPEDTAVAATFTHRLLTAYLPPIWGWFCLRWLQRHEYV